MLVSFDNRFVFIKTHKTASTSIEAALQPFCCPDVPVTEQQDELVTSQGIVGGRAGGSYKAYHAHMGSANIRRQIGAKTFDAFTKVIPIRNPFDKVVSWFYWKMPIATKLELKNRPFEETRFLFLNWFKMQPVLPIDRKYYQVDGKDFDAEFIRYERLEQDIDALGRKLGIDLVWSKVPGYKVSKREGGIRTADYYDAAAVNLLRKHFRYDFDRFEYSRDLPD